MVLEGPDENFNINKASTEPCIDIIQIRKYVKVYAEKTILALPWQVQFNIWH